MNDHKKLIGYLNIGVKAGKIVFGTDAILAWRKKVYGVIVCDSLSENAKRKLEYFSSDFELPPVAVIPDGGLGKMINKESVRAIAITNKELYTIIVDLIKSLG